MFTTIAITAVILIAALLGYAATRPDTFRVQRSKSIHAQPEEIFALINDFHRWGAWSPYEKLDPAMQRTFSGAENGKGAVYEWAGTRKVGEGRMEIMDTSPRSKVTIQLDFLKPFECHNTAEFTLEAEGSGTNVTWAMHGSQSLVAKAMSIFFSMDSLVGKDFETGLANMKAIAENFSNQRSALLCN
jgi:carbon monoxide dehydrogenase subunit G